MKTRISITVLFVLTCILLALPIPAQATSPELSVITADLYLTGPNSATGTFNANGDVFTESGTASEVFFTASDTIHGVKTLVGTAGSITIKFQAQLTWTSQITGVAQGRFVIISGTGAFEKLHGVGTTYATLDLSTGHLVATYSGTAHID